MARYLAYYRIENETHADVQRIGVSIEVINLVMPRLCREYGIPEVPVEVNPKLRNRSFYRPPPAWTHIENPRHNRYRYREEIVLSPRMMNWLTVAHELAHALHTHDYNRRSRAAGRPQPRERWNGAEHRGWLASVIGKLRSWGVLPDANHPALRGSAEAQGVDALEGDTRSWNTQMHTEALLALPARMLCPRCLLEKSREDFGTRTVRKTPGGRALKVIRQSYCRECR